MPERVLVVDDEEDIREVFSRALEKEGLAVDSSPDAQQALQMLKGSAYQVVVADIRMPGMDGITLLKKIKEISPTTDVIMATGYPATETAIQALRLGAFDYITKPCTLDELTHTVHKALEAQKLSTENLLLKRINAIHEVSAAFSTTLGLNPLLHLILEKGVGSVNGTGGSVFLLGQKDPVEMARFKKGVRVDQTFVKEVLQKQDNVVVSHESSTLTAIPLLARGEKLGVLCIEKEGEPFSAQEQKMLGIFAERAAAAIRDTKINEALQQKIAELEEAYRKLKQAQEQLIRTEKLSAIGELAAGVAHEINNPLATLLGYVQVLARNQALSETETRYLQIMEQEIERMARIVTGLLNFAHQEEPKKEKQALKPILEETLMITEHQIARYGPIEIQTEVEDNLPEVFVDRNQIQQVLVNLLLNAAQAMEGQGGKLTIQMHKIQEHDRALVAIRVKDTGKGLSEELKQKVFDPFFTTKEPGKGTGLGLSIAYGIVESHGGTIRVDGGENQGACFTVLLPFMDES